MSEKNGPGGQRGAERAGTAMRASVAAKARKNRPEAIRLGASGVIFHAANTVILALFMIAVLFPLVSVISRSVSSPSAVLNGRVTFLPVEPTFRTYLYVFRDRTIATGYRNSLLYMGCGTLLSVILTVFAAYPLSYRNLAGRRPLIFLFTFTMLFGGGMIPTYLVVRNLELINTMFALILPNAVIVYNMIIARTFFMNTIPAELLEAAEIDGASDFRTFFGVVLPLSGSIIAVLTLFYAVGLWNMYFDALIYINSQSKYPLQLVLRNIMTSAQYQSQMVEATGQVSDAEMMAITEALKYATIVCASLPVLALYPFIQKHFTRGIMIGSLKG